MKGDPRHDGRRYARSARREHGAKRKRPSPRRLAMLALAVGGAALLVAGVWVPAKAELSQWLLNRAWSGTQADRGVVRPWPGADTWPVARLRLPSSDAPLTVLSGTSGRNLAFAPAHMAGSALPGRTGVSVIAGHRDTHFRTLEALEVGERFEIELPDGSTFRYAVAAVDVVDADENVLRLDADESLVVLVTCYPFDAVTAGGSLRYVVTGRAVR